jgi:S1-C subfamily serine protease
MDHCKKTHVLRLLLREASLLAVFLAFAASSALAQSSPGPAGENDNRKTGVMIDEVAAGGPTEKAGILVHDIIITVDGTPVRSLRTILDALAQSKPGDTMQLTVARGPKDAITHVTMVLGASPIDSSQAYMGLTVDVGLLIVPRGEMPPTPKPQPPEV